MQIIDELEPAQRGPYCGMAGWIAGGERASFNVAIRTALVRGEETGDRDHVERGELLYSVGAGIVADSTPEGEWQETLDKAGVLKSEE
jgi:anthranilate/para-aminobenzoate synthase component I